MLFFDVVMEKVKLGNFSVNYALKKLNRLLRKLIGMEEPGREKIKPNRKRVFYNNAYVKIIDYFWCNPYPCWIVIPISE